MEVLLDIVDNGILLVKKFYRWGSSERSTDWNCYRWSSSGRSTAANCYHWSSSERSTAKNCFH